jgi:homoserine dehydrogenase
VEGIRHVTALDIKFAQQLGYTIKLLGMVKQGNQSSQVQVSVYPTLVPNTHVLANVNHVFNAVLVRGDVVGDALFYGRGAGKDATASSVLSDLADAALDLTNNTKLRLPAFVPHACDGCVLPVSEIISRYYVRLTVVDKPGVMAKISIILAAANIGISSVVQPEGHEGETVPLIFMLHDAKNGDVTGALAEISQLPVVKAEPVMIRVESFA